MVVAVAAVTEDDDDEVVWVRFSPTTVKPGASLSLITSDPGLLLRSMMSKMGRRNWGDQCLDCLRCEAYVHV